MATETMRLRELTVRYAVKRDDEGRPVMTGRVLTTPRESAAVLVPLLQHEPSEVFAVLFLGTRHHVLAYHEVGRGTLDTVLVTLRSVQGRHPRERRGGDSCALCGAAHNASYVSGCVMCPFVERRTS